MMIKTLVISALLLCFFQQSFCQDGVGIGTNNVARDAVLDVKSSEKGMLIPRTSTTTRTNNIQAIAESKGLMVYDTTASAFYYWDGADWIRLIASPGNLQLDMNAQKIINLANGTNANDAVNYGQLEAGLNEKLNLSGGMITGNLDISSSRLNMSGNKIINVSDGTATGDAVNVSQLQDEVNQLMNEIANLRDDIGILRKSSYFMNDITDTDVNYTINFPSVGTSNYIVLASFRSSPSTADPVFDNDLTYSIHSQTATSFQVMVRELSTDTQRVYFDYIIISI
ncbi:MAG: hypothetical protein RIC35_17280 [Marinoscillum sp.]